MEELIEKVEHWVRVRKLDTADPKAQSLKVIEEFTEMVLAYKCEDLDEVIDGVGDTYVTVIILSHQLGLDIGDIIQIKHATLEELWDDGFTLLDIKEFSIKRENFIIDLISRFTTTLSKSNEQGVLNALTDILNVADLLAVECNTTPLFCLQTAYDEIKDRKGMMVEGTFVKYDDLTEEQQEEINNT